ncbi:CPBP family intramembrane glutamic endopeptidase [Haloarcula halophila]|uniref:CPBP family intramembrane glutamic endopeptidase n=1 Tax=Haloarcula TaxID=2237 RepID=UPI0023E39B07|nr:type II CAAX endopeptidase family protein [Halomicroarcula sp. DFY41]
MARAADERQQSLLQTVVAVVSALGIGAGGLLFGTALTVLAFLVLQFGAGIDLTTAHLLVLGLIFVQGVGCAGVALAYVRFRPRIAPAIRDLLGIDGPLVQFDIHASVPSFKDVAVVVVGYFLALAAAIGGSLLASQLAVDTGTNSAAEVGMENPEIILLLIPASLLLVGPGEELLFRGVVQGRIRTVFNPVVGILVPSVAFAGLHWFALSGGSTAGNLFVVSLLVLPALVFGVSYEYTDNIVVPSLIHGFYNATLFTGLYFSVVYADQTVQSALLAL